MTAPILSNRLADLAERAGAAFRRGNVRSAEAAAEYLEAGAILAEAKAECGHGAWLPFLERAAIPERTARRMMRLHRSGMTPEALAAQGVKAALAGMARPPKSDTVADLPAAAAPDADPAVSLYQRRRAAGRCGNCGAPSDAARCEVCAARESERRKDRRGETRIGKRLAPRLAAAASAGRGVRLSAGEAAELAAMTGRERHDPL